MTSAYVCSLTLVIATPSDSNRHHQKRIESSLHENDVLLDTDAASQSSYRRDADTEAEEAFLLHTSWMDWPHGVSQRMRSQSWTLIGQYNNNYINANNKDESNSAKGGIAVATQPSCSFVCIRQVAACD